MAWVATESGAMPDQGGEPPSEAVARAIANLYEVASAEKYIPTVSLLYIGCGSASGNSSQTKVTVQKSVVFDWAHFFSTDEGAAFQELARKKRNQERRPVNCACKHPLKVCLQASTLSERRKVR